MSRFINFIKGSKNNFSRSLSSIFILFLLIILSLLQYRLWIGEGSLIEMFALQEELEELLEAKDQQALATKRADFLQRLNDLRYNYQQQLIKLKENTPDTTFCKQIQQQLNAERYLLRLLERCSSTSTETDL